MSIFDDWFGIEPDKQTVATNVPQYVTDAHRGAIGQAEALNQIGFIPSFGPQVAGATPAMEAAYQGFDDIATAFGMPAGAAGGLPQTNSSVYGAGAYATYPMFEENLRRFAEHRPAQAEAYNAMFMDPYGAASAGGQAGVTGGGQTPQTFTYDPARGPQGNMADYLAMREGITPSMAAQRIGADPVLRTELQNLLGLTGGQHKGGQGTGRLNEGAAAFWGGGGGIDPVTGDIGFGGSLGGGSSGFGFGSSPNQQEALEAIGLGAGVNSPTSGFSIGFDASSRAARGLGALGGFLGGPIGGFVGTGVGGLIGGSSYSDAGYGVGLGGFDGPGFGDGGFDGGFGDVGGGFGMDGGGFGAPGEGLGGRAGPSDGGAGGFF